MTNEPIHADMLKSVRVVFTEHPQNRMNKDKIAADEIVQQMFGDNIRELNDTVLELHEPYTVISATDPKLILDGRFRVSQLEALISWHYRQNRMPRVHS